MPTSDESLEDRNLTIRLLLARILEILQTEGWQANVIYVDPQSKTRTLRGVLEFEPGFVATHRRGLTAPDEVVE